MLAKKSLLSKKKVISDSFESARELILCLIYSWSILLSSKLFNIFFKHENQYPQYLNFLKESSLILFVGLSELRNQRTKEKYTHIWIILM